MRGWAWNAAAFNVRQEVAICKAGGMPGFLTMVLSDEGTADARTFNPDGGLRWKGTCVKTR